MHRDKEFAANLKERKLKCKIDKERLEEVVSLEWTLRSQAYLQMIERKKYLENKQELNAKLKEVAKDLRKSF